MVENSLNATFLFPIVILIAVALLAKLANKENSVTKLAKAAPLLAVIISIGAAVWIFQNGFVESSTLGLGGLGFSVRLDALSVTVYAMVSIIAIVVLRFSFNYLEGDSKRIQFIGQLAITIAFVQLLVISGNLATLFVAWVATSISLHQLLIFYPERKKARIAARKKFIIARIGDVTFLTALVLVYTEFGTGNLELIFQHLQETPAGGASVQLEIAALLFVLTAGLKSVQIPFHGWILEVMEAPTPVSALLHAGLLNAGPFLMIRFAYYLEAVDYAPIMLFTMGAVTALYGAVVFTTQPTIKTALAYSSVGHMGFTLMLCGLGLYSASLLHLIAHSFYKAHSFLSSGSAIEKIQTKNAATAIRKGSVLNIIIGFTIAVLFFITIAYSWGVNFDTPYQLLVIGGIIFSGIVGLLIGAFDGNNYGTTILKILGAAILVLMSFFGLEELVRHLLGSQVPLISDPTPIMSLLSTIMLILFFTTVLMQSLSPLIRKGNFIKTIGVHVRNGFYLNVIVDRLVSSLNHKR